jgi:hypothetical protein
VVLKRYVSPHDSLLRFFKQYMKLQEDIEIHEDAHEFAGEDKIVRLWSDFPMEKHIFSKIHHATVPSFPNGVAPNNII